MKAPEPFTADEARRVAETVRAAGAPECPRCAVPLDAWPVPPRDDVSYVRDRVWLVCQSCRRTVVVDRRDPR